MLAVSLDPLLLPEPERRFPECLFLWDLDRSQRSSRRGSLWCDCRGGWFGSGGFRAGSALAQAPSTLSSSNSSSSSDSSPMLSAWTFTGGGGGVGARLRGRSAAGVDLGKEGLVSPLAAAREAPALNELESRSLSDLMALTVLTITSFAAALKQQISKAQTTHRPVFQPLSSLNTSYRYQTEWLVYTLNTYSWTWWFEPKSPTTAVNRSELRYTNCSKNNLV